MTCETPSERIVRQWREGPLEAMPPAILLETAQRLLADNERLRAREAALVAVVKRVAASADGSALLCMCNLTAYLPSASTPTWIMDTRVQHAPDCVFAQARALLAASAVAGAGDADL